jgi:hypothetical protein
MLMDAWSTWWLSAMILTGCCPADPGEESAADWLAYLLTMEGRDEEAGRLRRFGLNLDRSIRCA